MSSFKEHARAAVVIGLRPRGRRAVLVLIACAGALLAGACFGSAVASAARGHVFSSAFGSKGSGPGQLTAPAGIAVNEATGDVYVVDFGNNRIERFSATGSFLGQFAAAKVALEHPVGIAVDNSCALHKPVLTGGACEAFDPSAGDVYVVDGAHMLVDKYQPTGAYLSSIEVPAEQLGGVATDSVGDVWIYNASSGVRAVKYDNAEPNGLLSTVALAFEGIRFAQPGFAVDSNDDLFTHYQEEVEIGEEAQRAAEYSSSGRAIALELASEESTALAVEMTTNDIYLDETSQIARLGPDRAPVERFAVPGAHSDGLAINAATETVYVADPENDVIDVFSAEPPSPPTVEDQSILSVTAETATVTAEINPRGAAATYRVEYGQCASAATCASSAYPKRVPVPDAPAGADFGVHRVTVAIEGLTPGAPYHFRISAENATDAGHPSLGAEKLFTTQPAAPLALPDGRQWEQASPVDKRGSLVQPLFAQWVIQASAEGSAITYVTDAPTEAAPQGNATTTQVLARRGPDGWRSQDLSIPHDHPTRVPEGKGPEYQAFSQDLSLAAVHPYGALDPQVSPDASEQTTFVAKDFSESDSSVACSPTSTCFTPLVTAISALANVPAGTSFGEESPCSGIEPQAVFCGPQYRAASPDMKHIVLESSSRLTEVPTSGLEFYEWTDGSLTLVSQLPQDEGGGPAIAPELGTRNVATRNAVSNDGSRVFFTTNLGSGEYRLYMRDVAKNRTLRLDTVQGGSESGTPNPNFQVASADGSKVWFTDTQQLTSDSGASQRHNDLFECEIVEAEGKLQCRLKDATPKPAEGQAYVQGSVIGASEDGSYVYFVANGKYTTDAVHGTCREAQPAIGSLCNVYVAHDGAIELVAIIGPRDLSDWARAVTGALDRMTARVSPNGRWLAFMSARSLTGYDNRDARSGEPDEELYLYNATTQRLVCASCNPSGARPVGAEYGDAKHHFFYGGHEVWEATIWLAAHVPGWTPYQVGRAQHQPRYLSNDGRLFFDARDPLVPQATNENWNVYQFEPAGVGGSNGCAEASAGFVASSGGCVALISAGTAGQESGLLDASESGNDVFFLTAAKLSPSDKDNSFDIYDAHQCTSESPCTAPPPESPPSCEAEASCRPSATAAPPVFGAPSSQTFSGVGNPPPPVASVIHAQPTRAQKLASALRSCRKAHPKSGKKRVACERHARALYGPKRAKHANTKRGSGR